MVWVQGMGEPPPPDLAEQMRHRVLLTAQLGDRVALALDDARNVIAACVTPIVDRFAELGLEVIDHDTVEGIIDELDDLSAGIGAVVLQAYLRAKPPAPRRPQ